MGAATRAHPSLGMTTTKTLRSVFLWRASFVICMRIVIWATHDRADFENLALTFTCRNCNLTSGNHFTKTFNFLSQLEEEKEDLARQLSHEKNARLLQEQINEEQVKLQDVLAGKEDATSLGAQVTKATRVPSNCFYWGFWDQLHGNIFFFFFGKLRGDLQNLIHWLRTSKRRIPVQVLPSQMCIPNPIVVSSCMYAFLWKWA